MAEHMRTMSQDDVTPGSVGTLKPGAGQADDALMAELNQAGAGVDRAIHGMLERGVSPVAVASALLGGALCLMSRTMGDEAVLQLLHNAAQGVRAGDLRR